MIRSSFLKEIWKNLISDWLTKFSINLSKYYLHQSVRSRLTQHMLFYAHGNKMINVESYRKYKNIISWSAEDSICEIKNVCIQRRGTSIEFLAESCEHMTGTSGMIAIGSAAFPLKTRIHIGKHSEKVGKHTKGSISLSAGGNVFLCDGVGLGLNSSPPRVRVFPLRHCSWRMAELVE